MTQELRRQAKEGGGSKQTDAAKCSLLCKNPRHTSGQEDVPVSLFAPSPQTQSDTCNY